MTAYMLYRGMYLRQCHVEPVDEEPMRWSGSDLATVSRLMGGDPQEREYSGILAVRGSSIVDTRSCFLDAGGLIPPRPIVHIHIPRPTVARVSDVNPIARSPCVMPTNKYTGYGIVLWANYSACGIFSAIHREGSVLQERAC